MLKQIAKDAAELGAAAARTAARGFTQGRAHYMEMMLGPDSLRGAAQESFTQYRRGKKLAAPTDVDIAAEFSDAYVRGYMEAQYDIATKMTV